MLLFIGLLLFFLGDLLLLLVLTFLLLGVLLRGFLLLLDFFLRTLLLGLDGSLGVLLGLVAALLLLTALFIERICNCCALSCAAGTSGTCRQATDSRIAATTRAESFLHLAHEALDGLGVTSREFKVGEATVGRQLNGCVSRASSWARGGGGSLVDPTTTMRGGETLS